MAVPKRKTTRAVRDRRRAHHDRVTAPNTIPCPNCNDMMLPHRVCPHCGHYKGREIVEIKTPAPVTDVEAPSEG